jgi:1-acyl-sn-glycerol-3-phosphate acyltransferase
MPGRPAFGRIYHLISKTCGMHLTIFETPVINTLMRWISIAVLRLTGWRVEGQTPVEKKYVLIAAPHTSNWDFP